MANTEFQTMFENAVHIGHRTQKWNPKMKKFIYGERNGIHLINLEKTAEYLEKALDFLSKNAAEGKTVLFVSTKPQSVKLLKNAARACNMPFVVNKWIPGLLTNYPTVKRRIRYMLDLREQEKNGEFEKYTKKEVSKMKKEMQKLQDSLGGVETMERLPDAIFVVDTTRDAIVVSEARRLGIPVAGFADTNADPTVIDFPIPANDDAIKSLTYLLKRIEESMSKNSKAKK